jgi:multisubunit Na+/H+ antiporter MnhB subunit
MNDSHRAPAAHPAGHWLASLRVRAQRAARGTQVCDRQLAYALQLALDGDMDGAKAIIAAAKAFVLARRTARGRFQYLKWSFGAAAVMIGLLFLASRLYPFQQASSDLWLAAKAGLIGAAFSIALAIRNRTVALDTELLANVTDGTLRLLIGVISAGVLLLLLASGILPSLKIGDANFSGSTLTWQMVLIIGFVGGFLERLVPDLLEKKNPQGNGDTSAVAGAPTR